MDGAPTASAAGQLASWVARVFPRIRVPRELPADYAQAWQLLARLAGVDDAELARRIAPAMGLPAADRLDAAQPDSLGALPMNFCQAHGLLPLTVEDGALVLATANPFDLNVADRAAFLARRVIRWSLAAPDAVSDALLAAGNRAAARQVADTGFGISQASTDLGDNAIVKLGQALLETAVRERASDLHVQPYLGAMLVRIRVDGQLQRLTVLPELVGSTLIRHFKARSGMEPTNMLIPQDGRMSQVLDGRDFDIRASSLPASRGERLVLRFLDQTRSLRLSTAGFSLAALQSIRRLLARPSGMVILTGPTGSGKTSTLYAMLAELNRASVNILTVENPVEYRLAGISQVEVNEKSGRTFGATLRSMLRQDPDIILVGEIRDAETAEVAVQAALTGHLVLSTLHTNDAVTAIPRLAGLGVAPNMLADALVGVVSQRLCRQLCAACRVPVEEPLSREESVFLAVTGHRPGARAVGCPHCGHSGFRGRLPLVDILENDAPVRDAVAAGETRLSRLAELRGAGLKSLAVSGSLRIVSGETTVAEVIAGAGPAFWMELAAYYGTPFDPVQSTWYPQQAALSPTALLITQDAALAARLGAVLEPEEFALSTVENPADGSARLRENDGIQFVFMDVADGTPAEDAAALLAEAGRQMYWSRLPAAVLLPESLLGAESLLRSRGIISPCLSRQAAPEELMMVLRSHRAR